MPDGSVEIESELPIEEVMAAYVPGSIPAPAPAPAPVTIDIWRALAVSLGGSPDEKAAMLARVRAMNGV